MRPKQALLQAVLFGCNFKLPKEFQMLGRIDCHKSRPIFRDIPRSGMLCSYIQGNFPKLIIQNVFWNIPKFTAIKKYYNSGGSILRPSKCQAPLSLD